MKCLFKGCSNNSRNKINNIVFFRFPANETIQNLWKLFCGLPEGVKIIGSHRLCSLHFHERDVYLDGAGKIRKASGAIPCYEDVAQISNPKRNRKVVEDDDIENLEPATQTSSEPGYYQDVEYLEEAYLKSEEIDESVEQDGENDVNCCIAVSKPDIDKSTSSNVTGSSECSQCVLNQSQKQQCQRKLVTYKNENAKLKRKISHLQSNNFNTILNENVGKDQLQLLTTGIKKVRKWSNESLIEGFKTKFLCGSTAYETERLKRQLPSGRTLRQKLQGIRFDTGILNEVFDLLRHKVSGMHDNDLDCAIIFDEMSIQQGSNYCSNLKQFVGQVTLPNHTGIANHVMVFMIVGFQARWKQVVAYHFSSDSIDHGCLKSILFDLIGRAEAIGLHVHAAVSDCGGNNKRLWNDLGIQHTQDQVLSNRSLKHPIDDTRAFEVLPDSTHVFKSMVQGWINNQTIIIPDDIVSKHNLQSPIADIKHLKDLVAYEEGCALKMACGLNAEDVDFSKSMSNLDKMKVKNSTKYVNHTVAAALRVYSTESGRTDILTTAFLIECMATWLDHMTSRSPNVALSKRNLVVYEKVILSLKEFRTMIFSVKVGKKGRWKPWQSAVVLATDSFMRLADYLLSKGYKFVLGGRLTQDCLENVFSQLRRRQMRPSALQVKDSLKLLSVSQYMTDIKNSSYDWDSRDWLVDFSSQLESLNAKRKTQHSLEEYGEKREQSWGSVHQIPDELDDENAVGEYVVEYLNLCNRSSEQNALYYIAGMILKQMIRRFNVCNACVNSCLMNEVVGNDVTLFTEQKDFTGSALIYVNTDTYNFFLNLEEIFKRNIDRLMLVNDNLELKFYDLMSGVSGSHMLNCHAIKDKITKRYIEFRLRVNRTKLPRDKRHDSKSMAI